MFCSKKRRHRRSAYPRVGSGICSVSLLRDCRHDFGPHIEKAKITKLTKSTKVITTAISPDGKYFAHVISDAGQQALFVRQTSANNDIPVIPLAPVEYWGITFSKDSNDLFYVTRNRHSPGQLYRMPALGGTPQNIMERLDSPVSFSPDGEKIRLCAGRFSAASESALLTANSDGTDEKVFGRSQGSGAILSHLFCGSVLVARRKEHRCRRCRHWK
jgi:hypothetical protein